MKLERFHELIKSPDARLTPEEVAKGWRFCICEWDGLLICAGDPESKFCSCFFDSNGVVKTGE